MLFSILTSEEPRTIFLKVYKQSLSILRIIKTGSITFKFFSDLHLFSVISWYMLKIVA